MDLTRNDVERRPVMAMGTSFTHLVSTRNHRQRQPIILIHGAGGAAWYWEEWVNYFTGAGGYPTTAPDLPGHGGLSHVNIRRMGVSSYIHHVAKYIKHVIVPFHGGHLPIIVGHSMGGLIAQKLSEMQLAHRTILIAPAPPHGIRLTFGKDFVVPFAEYPNIARSFFTGKPYTPKRKFLESLFIEPQKSKKMIDRCAEMQLYESPVAIANLLRSSIKVNASKVTVPMLVIGFEKDPIITADVVNRIADKYAHAERSIRADLGHLCPLEYGWKKVAKQCLDWFS